MYVLEIQVVEVLICRNQLILEQSSPEYKQVTVFDLEQGQSLRIVQGIQLITGYWFYTIEWLKQEYLKKGMKFLAPEVL